MTHICLLFLQKKSTIDKTKFIVDFVRIPHTNMENLKKQKHMHTRITLANANAKTKLIFIQRVDLIRDVQHHWQWDHHHEHRVVVVH